MKISTILFSNYLPSIYYVLVTVEVARMPQWEFIDKNLLPWGLFTLWHLDKKNITSSKTYVKSVDKNDI